MIEGVADELSIVQAAGAAAADPSAFASVTPPAAVFATRSESSRRWWGLSLVTVIWPVRAASLAEPVSESPRMSIEPPRTSIGVTRQPPLTAGTFGASTAAASAENLSAMKSWASKPASNVAETGRPRIVDGTVEIVPAEASAGIVSVTLF